MQSTLQPHSEAARDIATLWWWMLGAAGVVFAGTVAFITLSVVLRRREGVPAVEETEGRMRALVVLFGIVIPLPVLVTVFVLANFAVAAKTDAPGATPMTIEVVGRQWWFQARYPGSAAVTANEIHIPARTRVTVVVRTQDVIHSFWIPQLNRKIDLIPGQRNRIELFADRPGRYRGQCAEYCGIQHAHMGLLVIADEPARFSAWLQAQSAPARGDDGLFAQLGCDSCHTIRGARADGRVGPDLTHLASRSTIAALTLPNDRAALERWLRDPQAVKRGAHMPAVAMSVDERARLVAYLRTLR